MATTPNLLNAKRSIICRRPTLVISDKISPHSYYIRTYMNDNILRYATNYLRKSDAYIGRKRFPERLDGHKLVAARAPRPTRLEIHSGTFVSTFIFSAPRVHVLYDVTCIYVRTSRLSCERIDRAAVYRNRCLRQHFFALQHTAYR